MVSLRRLVFLASVLLGACLVLMTGTQMLRAASAWLWSSAITGKGHARRNPTYRMFRKANLDEVSHVVYQAYDSQGVLRYVGGGRDNRPQRVNSVTSHNFKFNFTKCPNFE